MTREEFIKVLEEEGYSYKIEGDKVVITHGKKGTGLDNHIYLDVLIPNVIFVNKGMVQLNNIASLPPGIEFKNGGDVDGNDLYKIEYPLIFQNRGHVQFPMLETICSGVEFNNGDDVLVDSLKSIPQGVWFKNKGDIYLSSLIGGRLDEWNGNIKGIKTNSRRSISSKILLNGMIKRGVFL